MVRAQTARYGVRGAAADLALLALIVTTTSCQSPASGPIPMAQLPPSTSASVGDSLPEVTISTSRNPQRVPDLVAAENRGRAEGDVPRTPAWYVTTVRDPIRGVYTAAIERQSDSRFQIDALSTDEPRAALALVIIGSRPRDLVLSLDGGEFVCAGRDQVCPLLVSIDDSPPVAVRFAVPRHTSATRLHLAGGADARRLLADIGKAKRLTITPTFKNEKTADIKFALTGVRAAIAKIVKRPAPADRMAAEASSGV
jgi:hypothetical protein